MVTKDEAYQKAKQYILTGGRQDLDLVVPEEAIEDHGWCWVFYWNTRAAVENDDPLQGLAGNAPVVAVKETGALYATGTAYPVEYFLEEIYRGDGKQVIDLPRPYRGYIYSREEAYEKAQRYILAQPSTVEIVVREEWVDNGGQSWAVYYNSRAFYETGDLRQMLNTPPLEVVKETGAMYLLGGVSPERYFREWVRLGRKPPAEFWWSR